MRSVHLGQVIMNVTCAPTFTSYMAGSVGMLYHLQDCDVIPMSGLQCYTYVWFSNLYLCPDWNVISMSGLQIYTYFCYTILYLLLLWLLLFLANLISDLLYLLLVCIFIPMSVISNSGFLNFTGYGIVCYIIFCAPLYGFITTVEYCLIQNLFWDGALSADR